MKVRYFKANNISLIFSVGYHNKQWADTFYQSSDLLPVLLIASASNVEVPSTIVLSVVCMVMSRGG